MLKNNIIQALFRQKSYFYHGIGLIALFFILQYIVPEGYFKEMIYIVLAAMFVMCVAIVKNPDADRKDGLQ